MKRTYGIIHGIATCKDCGWHTESHKNAQANAARHARAHWHQVNGEVGYTFTYFGNTA